MWKPYCFLKAQAESIIQHQPTAVDEFEFYILPWEHYSSLTSLSAFAGRFVSHNMSAVHNIIFTDCIEYHTLEWIRFRVNMLARNLHLSVVWMETMTNECERFFYNLDSKWIVLLSGLEPASASAASSTSIELIFHHSSYILTTFWNFIL